MIPLRYSWIVLAVLIRLDPAAAQTSTTKPPETLVTVCEVLNNRTSYDGKLVALIGRWSPTDEGFWLTDNCSQAVKTESYTWSNIIYLAYDPVKKSLFATKPKVDAIVAKTRIADMTARQATQDKLEWAVVYGRIETKAELPVVVASDGKTILPAGYGHLSAAPAQIIYRQNDLVILPKGHP
jgi:hypothetical protein